MSAGDLTALLVGSQARFVLVTLAPKTALAIYDTSRA